MYLCARNWGISPNEFWDMTLVEWFCEFWHNAPKTENSYAGNLTRDDVDELWDFMNNDTED